MVYKKNDLVTVTIEDIGSEGEGIGRVDGFTLFVKDAVVGDTALAKIVKNKKSYAYARLEKVLEASPFRVEPPCPFHRQCGGCQLQALSYEKQLEFKNRRIRNSLVRIGSFDEDYVDQRMEPILGMEEPWRYRNKAQYPVGTDRERNVVTGFYAGRTHNIIANTNCLLGAEENQEILEIILEHMRENRISAYDETTGEGLVRHILIRKGFTSGEIMVCLVLNKKMTSASYRKMKHPVEDRAVPAEDRAVPAEDRVVPAEDRVVPAEKRAVPAEDGKFLSYDSRSQLCSYEFIPEQGELLWKLGQIENMTSVSVNINADRTNVIMGREIYTIWGKSTFSDVIHMRDMTKEGFPFTGRELTFHISPLSFYQVNPVQTEKLYSTALEFAGLTGQETVWDLYCGIGTISLFMAGSAKKVYGVEIVPQAIEDARENARRNGITNAEFFVGKAEEVLPKFYARGERDSSDSGMLHPDVIVVDPPRKGCDEACLATMLKMQPKRIVYVSCDPATLARDVRVLCDGGYEVKRIRGCDMFSQSVHVETVCLLSKLREAKHQVSVTLDMDERNLTSAESKATYEEIKRYVAEHNDGMKVSSLNIAQVKRKCGLELAEDFNLPKSEDARQPQCPKEKEDAIVKALKAFKMI